jgi:hypothetical protein
LAIASNIEAPASPSSDGPFSVIGGKAGDAIVSVDPKDYPVVGVAANLFADDVQRVTGTRVRVSNSLDGAREVIIAGTLGHSDLIDELVAENRLKQIADIKGRWESTLTEIVEKPFTNIDRALVIVGSDRRGAAYGLTRLSEKIGVSPWYWWADAPVRHQDSLMIKIPAPQLDNPGVKYRGIFINDEDWGIHPWAAQTFDPGFKNIGPKTYEKVFELMLRLRLNYLWPAMHPCTVEFGSVSANVELADKYGIVAGSSHCEPMLCNNVHWNEASKGRWNYSLNRNVIHDYWEENVKARSRQEAVWTLGMRGIHDAGLESPPADMDGKISLLNGVFHDQRELIQQNVTKEWGEVAQCFVPYKEVLPIYDAGLNVPGDVTLVWTDDNFGYLRRLSSPLERARVGGSGVYFHFSYYGPPHSYTWINTTPPSLIWEELHKAWENGARNLWVINVGDIKPMEIGIDYFSRLAWSPEGFDLGAQREFLRGFAVENFGAEAAPRIADLLIDFYRLGTVRKPELMNRKWAVSLPDDGAARLESEYSQLFTNEEACFCAVPKKAKDAYQEMIGFPAKVVSSAGLIFMADRKVQSGIDVPANDEMIADLRANLERFVSGYNTNVASGKWNRMMPGLVTGRNTTLWSSQVRWPWGEKGGRTNSFAAHLTLTNDPPRENRWHDAAAGRRSSSAGVIKWRMVEGLGGSGHAMALLPTNPEIFQNSNREGMPELEYEFVTKAGDYSAYIEFLPTFRIYPGMLLRVAVGVDDQPALPIEVPGSSGKENENGPVRSLAIQNNYVRVRIPLPGLAEGGHLFKIRAIDPGVVIDRISLP